MDLNWNTNQNTQNEEDRWIKGIEGRTVACNSKTIACTQQLTWKLLQRLKCSPWWLNSSDNPENYLNWVTLASYTLSPSVGLKIFPMLICTNPGWDPLGGLHTS